MSFFNFLKGKTAEDYFGKVISFTVDNISREVLSSCKTGDYVNLWVKPEMDRVLVYAPNSVGGSGQLGTIPSKYFKIIKTHILGQKDYGFSGPSTNNYDASIVDLSGSNCTVAIRLFSPEQHEQIIVDMIKREKAATKADLEKKYKMTKPVEIKFDLKKQTATDLKNLKIKIFEKEFYIEHPYDYKLQLIDESNQVIAETVSQKDKIFRVVKGHYNGQSIIVSKIERGRDNLQTTIIAE